ncbi:hypothetical protein MPLSOD_110137 [Mesorhizobium sp. SOD10]|nr:hypothetical protein MPLSOD_110137 [Mesorhizobium sp. SOD10]
MAAPPMASTSAEAAISLVSIGFLHSLDRKKYVGRKPHSDTNETLRQGLRFHQKLRAGRNVRHFCVTLRERPWNARGAPAEIISHRQKRARQPVL